MYISGSFMTVVLLFCSSIGITALASDPVAVNFRSHRPNPAAVEAFSIDEKRLDSNKRHDFPLRLSNHLAAHVPRAEPAPAAKAAEPATEAGQPTVPELAPGPAPKPQTGPNAPVGATKQKQNDENDNNKNNKDVDEHKDGPDGGPDHKKNEGGEGGTDHNSRTESHENGSPEDGNNSTTKKTCAHHSGAASANCISTAMATKVKVASTTSSSFTSSSSSSTSTFSSPTATITTHSTIQPQLAPVSTTAPAPTLSSSSTGAAAGIDARNPFARLVGGNSGVVAMVGVYMLWSVLRI